MKKKYAISFSGNKEQIQLVIFDFKSFLSLLKNTTYRILDIHVIQRISAQSLFHVRFRGGKNNFLKI